MARTVDHISGGRVVIGLGAGWFEPDYTEYGYEYGSGASRHGVFVDALERIRSRLPRLVPPPLHPIPILIGGSGEKRTLPAVAKYADIWHIGADVPTFLRKDEVLIEAAERIGRDAADIERAVSWHDAESSTEFANKGATLFTVSIHAADDHDLTELKDAVTWRDSGS